MSEHQIQLTTRDGQLLSFACDGDTDVISAAEKRGIKLQALCRAGCCGLCLAHWRAGDFRLGNYSENILPEESRDEGLVLLCCTYPKSDLRIDAPYEYSRISFVQQASKTRPAVISDLKTIAGRTVQLCLTWQQTGGSATVEFEAGQYMELEIPDTGIRRAYSLVNTPNSQGQMMFLIRLLPEGKFSNYLTHQAAVGQVLLVHEAAGSFTFQAHRACPAIFVAGGTGIAPFVSMLSRFAERGEDRAIHVLFGVNQESEVFFVDELSRLQQKLPRFSFELCVWKPEGEWGGFIGTPADALQQYLDKQGSDFDVYLCGPPKLVSAATAIAHRHGIGEDSIFIENFA